MNKTVAVPGALGTCVVLVHLPALTIWKKMEAYVVRTKEAAARTMLPITCVMAIIAQTNQRVIGGIIERALVVPIIRWVAVQMSDNYLNLSAGCATDLKAAGSKAHSMTLYTGPSSSTVATSEFGEAYNQSLFYDKIRFSSFIFSS
jgi:hypothetical protein